jgi:serine/threonine protein kinase
MSKSDKRHTQIDFKSLRNFHKIMMQQENESNAPTDLAQSVVVPHINRNVHSPREDTVSVKRSQSAGSFESPTKTRSNVNLASPWSKYKQIYRLQLGNDFYVTVAEERAFPYNEVFVQQFLRANVNQLQLMQQIRHPNFVTVLNTFWLDDTNYVVFKTMPVSLGDLATSSLGVDTICLAAIVKQVSCSRS